MKKNILKITVMTGILIFLFSTIAYALIQYGTFSCWYSSSNTIGKWFDKSPCINSEIHGFPYTTVSSVNNGINRSINVWSSARIYPYKTSSTTPDIKVFFADLDYMTGYLGYWSGAVAETNNGATDYGRGTYGSVTKKVFNIHTSIIYYVPNPAYYDDYIVSHEVGHALGYYGHISNSTALMYSSSQRSTNAPNLSANEASHMKNLY